MRKDEREDNDKKRRKGKKEIPRKK